MNRGQWIEHWGWYITYNLTLPLIISTTNTLQEHILNNQLFQKSWNSGRWQGWSQARFTQQMWNHLPPRLLHCFPSGKGLRGGEQICSRKLLLKAWWSQGQLTKRSYMHAAWVWMRSFYFFIFWAPAPSQPRPIHCANYHGFLPYNNGSVGSLRFCWSRSAVQSNECRSTSDTTIPHCTPWHSCILSGHCGCLWIIGSLWPIMICLLLGGEFHPIVVCHWVSEGGKSFIEPSHCKNIGT